MGKTANAMKHGSRSTYVNKGCRCSSCRKANRDYQRPYMRSVYKLSKFKRRNGGIAG